MGEEAKKGLREGQAGRKRGEDKDEKGGEGQGGGERRREARR